MKILYAFIISTAVFFGASVANANIENEIKKITENTPLVLQHADSVFDNDSDSITAHYSHSSHRSHRSHFSHRSGY